MRSKKDFLSKKFLSSFCNFSTFNFQFSTFPFTIFLLFLSIFTPFPIFPCLFFPGRSAEISRTEVSRGTLPGPLPPPPACYATDNVTIMKGPFRLKLVLLIVKKTNKQTNINIYSLSHQRQFFKTTVYRDNKLFKIKQSAQWNVWRNLYIFITTDVYLQQMF